MYHEENSRHIAQARRAINCCLREPVLQAFEVRAKRAVERARAARRPAAWRLEEEDEDDAQERWDEMEAKGQSHWWLSLDDEVPAVLNEAAPEQRAAMAGVCVAVAAAETSRIAQNDELAESSEESWWDDLGGDEFCDALDGSPGHSPVRLVDARFLIALAQLGARMPRRQELPDGAFVPLERLRRVFCFGGGKRLPVVCISHPWLQPDHPDPHGATLRRIARALKAYLLSASSYGIHTAGVFFDFASLHQRGARGEERTPAEAALFGRALSGLSDWYSHPQTTVLKVTRLPEGYPDGHVFAPGSSPNVADYAERGWCYCESMLSNLVKGPDKVLDLGALEALEALEAGPRAAAGRELCSWAAMQRGCKAGREAPLTAAEFTARLALKSFTSKKADLDTVARLYAEGFAKRLGAAKELNYSGLDWGDAEAAAIARVLASGAAPLLEVLKLDNTRIGDAGVLTLVEALHARVAPKLERLLLYDNGTIHDEGMAALAGAVRAGDVPACHWIGAAGNPGEHAAVEAAVAAAVKAREGGPS